MRLNKVLRRIAQNARWLNIFERNGWITGTPIVLPGLLDDSAQRLATEAKHAADTKAGVEKINLHPDLLGKKKTNTSSHIPAGHNFLKSYFQHLTYMCEYCKSYVKLYNTFSLQKVYL